MKNVLFIVFLCTYFSASCQIDEVEPELYNATSNVINLSALVSGAIFSVNYERRLRITNSIFLYPQIGIGYNEEFSIAVPCLFGPCGPSLPKELFSIFFYNITVNTNIHKLLKYLELGVGATHAFGLRHNTQHHLIYALGGIRVQMLKNTSLRFAVNIPFFGLDGVTYLFFPVGCSIGFNF